MVIIGNQNLLVIFVGLLLNFIVPANSSATESAIFLALFLDMTLFGIQFKMIFRF